MGVLHGAQQKEGLGDTVLRRTSVVKSSAGSMDNTLKLMATFTMRLPGVDQRAAGDQGTQQQAAMNLGKSLCVTAETIQSSGEGKLQPHTKRQNSGRNLNLQP